MANTFRVIDYDIVYLSYDEPNAEKNYADLCKKVPFICTYCVFQQKST